MKTGGKFKKNTVFIALVLLFAAVFFFILHNQCLAVDIGTEVGAEAGLGGADIRTIVARIINVFLGLLAAIAVCLVIYGGFLWMTSGGSPEKVDKAKKVLINAAIGLGIILASWGITVFIFQALLGEGIFGPAGPPGAPSTYEGLSGALGNGIIDYHYPARRATDVPRNTKILVTFKTEMSIPSFVQGYEDNGTPLDTSDDTISDLLNQDNIKIFVTADGEGSALAADQVRVNFTDDLKTFVFQPVEWLGSASGDVAYTVTLGSNIKRADGEDAFQGVHSEGYGWRFDVGTFVDLTPPQVKSVFPVAGGEYPRNAVIQINFSEPIDPISATGHSSRFTNIIAETGSVIIGTFSISNQYKTIEFLTDEVCGRNSCGGDVFCLPGNSDITVTVKAASMNAGEEPTARFPYNGVVDMASNSLDGNRDDEAQGPPGDNYVWLFSTNNTIQLEPPGIDSVSPQPSEGGIAPDLPLTIKWDILMSFSSLNSSNILLGSSEEQYPVWFTLGSENYDIDDQPVEGEMKPHHTITDVMHGLFLEETVYFPEIFFDVKDIFQNCFNPASTRDCPKDREFAPWCCDREASPSRTTGPCAGIPIKER